MCAKRYHAIVDYLCRMGPLRKTLARYLCRRQQSIFIRKSIVQIAQAGSERRKTIGDDTIIIDDLPTFSDYGSLA